MADQVNEFGMNEQFDEKVIDVTVFNGKVFIAREDGVFEKGDDDVFRRVDLSHAPGESHFKCDLPNMVMKC